jgi:hypothetical protein
MKNRQLRRQVSGNRLFTWMMIGIIFFLIDLAILFYFLRPESVQVDKQAPAVPAVQQETGSISTEPNQSSNK